MPEGAIAGKWAGLRGLLVLIALAGFAPLFALGLYQAIEARRSALAEGRAMVERLARFAEDDFAGQIRGTLHLLHAMAANPALRGEDAAACSAALDAQQDQRARYSAFAVIALDGRQLCTSDAAAAPAEFADREHFRRAVEIRKPAVGKPVVGGASQRSVLPVAQPLLDARGEVERVLVAGLDLAWVGAAISGALGPSGLLVTMWDDEGRLLYRRPDEGQWSGKLVADAPIAQAVRTRPAGVAFEAAGLDGVSRIYALAHSREHAERALVVSLGIARDALTAPAERAFAIGLALLGLVSALALFAMIYIAERFVRAPVAALARASDRLAGGDLAARVPHEAYRAELGALAGAFNRMATRLQETLDSERASRAQAEQALERSRALLEAAPDAVVIADAEGRIALVNGQVEKLFGYARAELLGEPVEKLMPERFRAAHASVRRGYAEAPSARPMGAGRTLYARRKDGSEFPVDISLSPLATPEGLLVIGTVRDMTERRLAEARIQAQLEHLGLLDRITRAIGERQDMGSIFQVVLNSVEDSLPLDFACVCLHDPAGKVLRVAHIGAKSAGLAAEMQIAERTSIDVDANGLARCLDGQLVYEPHTEEARFPFPVRLARGGLHSLAMTPLRSESSVFGILVAARRAAQAFASVECEFLRQLSEHVALAAGQARLYGALQQAYEDLRQTQQAVLQQERLRALGQMASGIAHDINNAISPVTLYAEALLENEPGLTPTARDYLATIQRAAEDVAQSVSRMREFYRQREPAVALAAVDLNRVVEQVADLTRARWYDMAQQRGAAIELRKELAADLPAVMGVESEIREALTNLVFNAVDAMPEGGTLTLRTRAAERPAGPGEAHGQREACVEVIDTGVGMDEDTQRRCLEPFFSTKGERGTGLGLAMVFGIVQRHSADIQIESAPGEGTTMRLVFAVRTDAAAEPAQPASPFESEAALPRLRLLLVDDDPMLIKSLRDVLEADGHDVTTAAGGQEGIAAFRAARERGAPFAAVITDLGMPYVDGRKVAQALKAMSPGTPVILLTGWGQRLAAEGDVPPNVDCVLNKPPRPRDLRAALARWVRSGQP